MKLRQVKVGREICQCFPPKFYSIQQVHLIRLFLQCLPSNHQQFTLIKTTNQSNSQVSVLLLTCGMHEVYCATEKCSVCMQCEESVTPLKSCMAPLKSCLNLKSVVKLHIAFTSPQLLSAVCPLISILPWHIKPITLIWSYFVVL